MSDHQNIVRKLILLGAIGVVPIGVLAQNDAVDALTSLDSFESEMEKAFGDDALLSIATGRNQHISDAPAVATVITAAEIQASGAKSLNELLNAVPGLHISQSATSGKTFLMRGVYSLYNPHVLLLVDGVPQTNALFGNRGQAWGDYPVQNIARIEVIRGPGSAVYGADAFAGVINIVTKTARDSVRNEVGLRAGSFNSKEAWAGYRGHFGGLSLDAIVSGSDTSGHRKIIDADAQTVLDSIPPGTSASYAPGPTNNQQRWIDASFALHGDAFKMTAQVRRRELGTGVGFAEALDPAGHTNSNYASLTVDYRLPLSDEAKEITVRSFVTENQLHMKAVLYPPGVNLGMVFNDGLIGIPATSERHYGIEGNLFFYKLPYQTLRASAGSVLFHQYKTSEIKNFNNGSTPGVLVDVTDTEWVFSPEKKRGLVYGLIQDEWLVTRDWNITVGLRGDYYTDIGYTFNPRAASVWQLSDTLSAKMIYGQAFRPPSFAELYNKNNPLTLGNANLKPETVTTYEIEFDYYPSAEFSHRFNIYYYSMNDIIQFVPDPMTPQTSIAQNIAKQNGQGIETELKWRVQEKHLIKAQYAYSRSLNGTTDAPIGFAPMHKIGVGEEWTITPSIAMTVNAFYVGGRKRPEGDTREPVSDYINLSANVRWNISNSLNIQLAGNNLLNDDIREPSSETQFIPHDIPLEGINGNLSVTYTY